MSNNPMRTSTRQEESKKRECSCQYTPSTVTHTISTCYMSARVPGLQRWTGLQTAFGSADTPRPVPCHGAPIAFRAAARACDCLSLVLRYSPTPCRRLGTLLHRDVYDGCAGVAGVVGMAGVAGDDGGGVWVTPRCLCSNRRSAHAPNCWPSSSAGSST